MRGKEIVLRVLPNNHRICYMKTFASTTSQLSNTANFISKLVAKKGISATLLCECKGSLIAWDKAVAKFGEKALWNCPIELKVEDLKGGLALADASRRLECTSFVEGKCLYTLGLGTINEPSKAIGAVQTLLERLF